MKNLFGVVAIIWQQLRSSSAAFGHTAFNELEVELAAVAEHLVGRIQALEQALNITPPEFKPAPAAAAPAQAAQTDLAAVVAQLSALVKGIGAKVDAIAAAPTGK